MSTEESTNQHTYSANGNGARAPHEGEFIPAGEGTAKPAGESARSRVASIFSVAEARLNAAHAAVAEHVDRRVTSQFAAEKLFTDDGAESDPVAADMAGRMAQRVRDDLQSRQRNIADRLSAGMQALAFADIGHATEVANRAGMAAADALRPERDITPDSERNREQPR